MIDIEKFVQFLKDNFEPEYLFIDKFKSDLVFAEIDCLRNSDEKLALAISTDKLEISTVSKEPVLDFSLYDFSIDEMTFATDYILQVKESGTYFIKKNKANHDLLFNVKSALNTVYRTIKGGL